MPSIYKDVAAALSLPQEHAETVRAGNSIDSSSKGMSEAGEAADSEAQLHWCGVPN